RDALGVYREIQALDEGSFQAPVLHAAYSRALGDTNAAAATMRQLLARYPETARSYLDRFSRIDEIIRMVPKTGPYTGPPLGKEHAIVILGAALETNSLLKPKLVDRLRQGLTLAKLYPEAPVLVTGGNARGGVTEAYGMSSWLRQEGVSTNRLYLEDQARDTVGNAFKSCDILRKLGIGSATLVTSASHIRRALADFEEAARQRGLAIQFFHLAAKDEPTVDEARERVSIYRDAMRASGIWAYPGIQQ
ncbi:MAG TPA: YdcF family protein, partial [Verrucomicrobiae bacterium]|nr:YdcF family protein [Verrucomicrobiae bacterium]